MGAVFNTDKTIKILAFLNRHYSEHTVLRNAPNGRGCAQQLGLDDLVTPGLSARWNRWLDLLDQHRQDGSTGGQWVRTMMADALQEPGCNGIEFFAVPAQTFRVIHPAPKVPDDPNHPDINFTRVIIVETNTIDNTIAFTPIPWWRRIFFFGSH
jgi:hypothetical protein